MLWVQVCVVPGKLQNCARTVGVIKRPQARSEHPRQDRRESEAVPPKSARLPPEQADMVSDDEKSERLTRTLSDPALLNRRPGLNSPSRLDDVKRESSLSARDVYDAGVSRPSTGAARATAAASRQAKQPSWGRNAARALFSRSTSPKMQEGESSPVLISGGPSGGAAPRNNKGTAGTGAPPRPQRASAERT